MNILLNELLAFLNAKYSIKNLFHVSGDPGEWRILKPRWRVTTYAPHETAFCGLIYEIDCGYIRIIRKK